MMRSGSCPELVGCFILSQITKKFDKPNIGLYRDDGLAVFRNTNGPQMERIKKEFQKIFKKNKLDIIVECNMKKVNFLDVTLDLESGSCRPYHKPDNETNYIHIESNHLPNVIKQVPLSIQTRLFNLSSNEQIFSQAKQYYKDALERSGYNKHKLQYTSNLNQQQNRRQRKIIWFNPRATKT